MICHWDEVASGRAEAGHIAGEWTDLGEAAGTKTVGLNRIRIDPRKWSTPFHRHTAEEEIFYVLAGSGICLLDGSAFEVRPGDCIVHWGRLEEGEEGAPPHLHCADEEIFVVLEGEGLLELWPTPQLARGGREYEEQPIRAGQVVSRPASTGVAHGFRAGQPGLTYSLVRDAEPERRLLLRALEQALLPRPRPDRPPRGPRLRRRRAAMSAG